MFLKLGGDVKPLKRAATIGVLSTLHQQFIVYELPHEINPEREIRNGRNWLKCEALDLLYKVDENLFDV